MTKIFNSFAALGLRRLALLAVFGWLIVGAETIVLPVHAHADSMAEQFCDNIAENPTEAGTYQAIVTLVVQSGSREAMASIGQHAVTDICPQYAGLVIRTARDNSN